MKKPILEANHRVETTSTNVNSTFDDYGAGCAEGACADDFATEKHNLLSAD